MHILVLLLLVCSNTHVHCCVSWPIIQLLSLVYAEFCEKYAKPEDAGITPEDKSSDEEELSEDEDDSGDEDIVGKPDP